MAHQTFEYKEIDGGLHITCLKDKSLSEIEIPATIDSKNVKYDIYIEFSKFFFYKFCRCFYRFPYIESEIQ